MIDENHLLAAKQMTPLVYAYYAACIEKSDKRGFLQIDPEEVKQWFLGGNKNAGRYIETLLEKRWLFHLSDASMTMMFKVFTYDEHESMRADIPRTLEELGNVNRNLVDYFHKYSEEEAELDALWEPLPFLEWLGQQQTAARRRIAARRLEEN